MTVFDLEITNEELRLILEGNPNMGKNSDVGKAAIKLVKLFFSKTHGVTEFYIGKEGADIIVSMPEENKSYEVKGTAGSDIAWSKLKVSSQHSYNAITNGLEIIRVTNVGQQKVKLHFITYGVDFTLVTEARWAVKKLNDNRNINKK